MDSVKTRRTRFTILTKGNGGEITLFWKTRAQVGTGDKRINIHALFTPECSQNGEYDLFLPGEKGRNRALSSVAFGGGGQSS